jgi:PKD repeat protein
MTRPFRIAKRLIAPALLAATLVVVQVVLAAPPTASFTVTGPNNTTTCGLYTFTDTSTDDDNDIQAVVWDLAGTPATGSTVQTTFATPGARTINMTVTDGLDGDATPDVASASKSVTVGNGGPPNAAFTATPNPVEPNTSVTFNGAGSTAQGGGSIARYEWDLDGNGSYETDTGAAGTATLGAGFATNGVHTVNLRVTDNCGGVDTVGASVFVNNSPPTASFTVAPNPAAINATVTFNGAASSDTGGAIAKYEWDLDADGTFETDTGAVSQATKAFAAAGSYIIQLRVTDGSGATATTFRQLRVNAKPTATFSYSPLNPLIGEAVAYDGTTSADPDGTIATYEWDLDGDGSFETTGATPTHTYLSPGTVNVRLRVTDSDGTLSDVVQRVVTIQATRPNPGFTYAPDNPVPGQPVTLTSTSAPSASPGAPALVATQWDFNYSPIADFTLDGAGASIVTSFATPGPHPVAVKVTETGGGFAIATGTIPVNAPPQAAFTVSPAKPVEGKEVTFASTSGDPDGPLAKQEWDLNNDGKFERSGGVVSTTKLKHGSRKIGLRVTDSKGATATSVRTIAVKPPVLRNPQNVVSSVSYERHSWGIRVVSFTLKTPAKTSVAVSCKGRGCPHGTFHKRTRKKGATLGFPQLKANLHAGAKVNIIFARAGRITGWDVITVRGGKTALREGCKPRGAKKQKRCP